MKAVPLAPGVSFFDELAVQLLEAHAVDVVAGDLSALRVLVPALPMAAELRSALLRIAPNPLLLPRFDTLRHWVLTAPLDGIPDPLPDSQRLVLLHNALRVRGWFDEAALWGIASEMAGLFDELTSAAVQLADDEVALSSQLERAYALRASAPMAFEARVVHELWRALAGAGSPDGPAVYRLRLAELARSASQAEIRQPLLVLLDAAPDEALDAAELGFLECYGEKHSLQVFYPAPRETCVTPLMTLLDAAWPQMPDVPLFDRAHSLAQRFSQSPLGGRFVLTPATGREAEAQAAVAQIAQWLQKGLRRIALVAQDRLTARRVRALLEREGVLVSDETGWLLSTSRAAAAVDALIETVSGNAYHRDLLDLFKSPYLFSDIDETERKASVATMESVIRQASVKGGLSYVRAALIKAEVGDKAGCLALLERLDAASAFLNARPVPLPRWISRLYRALEVLGALVPLGKDAAGKTLLDLLEQRQQELKDSAVPFSLKAWRDWLNREFETTSFRDAGIVSPIVVTPLNAICLRCFEAALLLGGDAQLLAPACQGKFFNQSVRRELGLRTREDSEQELRRDLELLLASVPHVAVTWQSTQNGEANLLAPELSLLSTLHKLAWNDDLHRLPLPGRADAKADVATAPQPVQAAAPVLSSVLIPQRISVSSYVSLVACPYLFFARHALRLGEMSEVSEEMEKSDYGALVHLALERFHKRLPRISDLSENDALSALRDCVKEVFAPAVESNFLATGWQLRWEKRLSAYIAWQRAREAEGWFWERGEAKVRCAIVLDDGGSVELYGRIDRIDGDARGDSTLLDYKTQSAQIIRDRLKDDVQLAAYALMYGQAVQAAYVVLDDEKITAIASGKADYPLMNSAEAHGQRLRVVFNAMYNGVALPANGADSVCRYCEMRGLCRQEFV